MTLESRAERGGQRGAMELGSGDQEAERTAA